MASTATATTATGSASKKRVQQPNKGEFDKNLTELEKELRSKEKDLEAARNNVNKIQGKGGSTSSSGSTDERKELYDQMDVLKKKQAELKNAQGKVLDQVRAIDDQLKKKIENLKMSKSKHNFKSVDEIDGQIKKLERAVESGNLRLVDEKKHLVDISSLKRAKKNFGSLAEAQASIDADRARITELRSTIDDSELKTVNSQFKDIKAKLDVLKGEQQAAYKDRNSLYEKRNNAVKARDEVREKIKSLKDTYYGQLREYRDQAKAEQAARIEREKQEKASYERQKKLQDAQEQLELAKEPAYTSEIATAENLLAYFDPEYKKTGESASTDNKFAAKATRTVEQVPTNAKIIKKDTPDFFSGSSAGSAGGKKNKKGGKSADKFSMDLGIIDDLSNLKITVPSGKEDVPNTISKLKEKIEYFKQNQEKATAEKVEKAKAQLAKLEKEVDSEPAAESTTEEN